jgi:hypothetical protein
VGDWAQHGGGWASTFVRRGPPVSLPARGPRFPASFLFPLPLEGAPPDRLPLRSSGPEALAELGRFIEPYAFAGLWETWQPPEGALLETFTILTTAPNSLTEPIHDRMPVIVEPKDYDRWMDPSTAPPLDLLRPYAAESYARVASQRAGTATCAITLRSLLDEVHENQQSLFS